MNGLSLFSGIGGIDVALSEYVRPIAYCELDRYCQGVLLSRMADESLPNCPVWNDVTTLDGNIFKGAIDIIYGGFPCQDISVAGHGAGLEGKRSGLFFEIMRLAKEIKPKFIFLENVPAITTRGGLRVVREIAEMGYDCRWCHVSAAEVGARHKRERWFLLGYAKHDGLYGGEGRGSVGKMSFQRQSEQQRESQEIEIGKLEGTTCLSLDVADTMCERFKESGQPCRQETRLPSFSGDFKYDAWGEEPKDKLNLVGVVDGIPFRTHRIKSLGNSVVPLQVKKAFKILMGIK